MAEGGAVPEVAKALEVLRADLHRWRARYGGMKADDATRLKELERENMPLTRIVADQLLEHEALRKVANAGG